MLIEQPHCIARRRLVAAACLIALGLVPAPVVRAQGSPVAPPLDELVARALANAPSIAARRARLAAAQAALPAADAPRDLMVEFEWRDGGFPKWTLGSDPMSMIGGTVRQELVSKGRKNAGRASAAAEVDLRHAETDAAACDLIMAVRVEYGRLYAIDQERAILRDAEEMASLIAETATSRYASGASDQAAVLRAQLERTRLSERAADLEADRRMSVATLNRLLNQPPDTPIGEVRELPEPPPLGAPLAALPAQAGARAPEVAVGEADVAAASRRVEAAQADLKPIWTLGGSFFWQGNTDRVVAFTVGVELPASQGPPAAADDRGVRARTRGRPLRPSGHGGANARRGGATRRGRQPRRRSDRPLPRRPAAAVVGGARRRRAPAISADAASSHRSWTSSAGGRRSGWNWRDGKPAGSSRSASSTFS